MQPVTSTFTMAVQQVRSIADHCACTTAWSQCSCSFDRPVRTRDVLKLEVVLSPGRLFPDRAKTGTCERGLTKDFTHRHQQVG